MCTIFNYFFHLCASIKFPVPLVLIKTLLLPIREMLMPDLLAPGGLQRRIALYDDDSAYRELYFLFYKPLLHFTNSFVADLSVSEDIVSDVFLKVWQNRKRLTEIRNLRVYLYVSAKNNAFRHLHSRHKVFSLNLDDLDVEVQSSVPDPEQIMITTEILHLINRAIEALPPRCKMIYKLVREDRLRYKEISQILDISIKTIDNQLAIALKKIASAILFDLPKV